MTDPALRRHLVAMLQTGHAHVSFETAVAGWDIELRGVRPEGGGHTAWELVEHLRIAQWDILEFSRSADHVSPDFPDGYWPPSPAPPGAGDWDRSVGRFAADLEAMQALVSDPARDLYERIPHGEGQTLLREALTLASHNSYHVGQLMSLRKVFGLS